LNACVLNENQKKLKNKKQCVITRFSLGILNFQMGINGGKKRENGGEGQNRTQDYNTPKQIPQNPQNNPNRTFK